MAVSVEKLAERKRENGAWQARLQLTPTHQPKASLANALLALREAPAWQGVLAHDGVHTHHSGNPCAAMGPWC